MALENDIMMSATKVPLVLDLESPSTQIERVMTMLQHVNCQHMTNAKPPKDCAILFKRFCIYSEAIFKQMPNSMKSNYQGKLATL